MKRLPPYIAGAILVFGIAATLRPEPHKNSAAANMLPAAAQAEIASVMEEINRIEADALEKTSEPSLDRSQELLLLGKLLFYDRNLSVERNEACAFCHMPETGFSGPISALNQTKVSYPGSIRTRFSGRNPQTHGYASFSPVLHYNVAQGDLVGGAFWDMRATGLRLNSPLAEQAQGPPLNPLEMGMIDAACVVYRVSERPYRPLAERLWGAQAFAIRWPRNVRTRCEQPGPAPASDPLPVHLSPVDRGIAENTFDRIAQTVAAYEGSEEVNSFSSKYDFVLAGKAQFTPQERIGYALFRSKTTHCNECHRDGGPGEEPLFTDFTASNLGLPSNPDIPFHAENKPDRFGYIANPAGAAFVDPGVGGFLQSPLNPMSQWASRGPLFAGKYKTPTLRNVDRRPRPDFVKAYMHNGYLKSLREIVHFYNTRDALPKCIAGDPREKVSCWPAPEHPETMNRRQLGNLGLSSEQEESIVAFLKTLTDGYQPEKP
jgi:cytochrome c peroxidase